MIDQSDSAAIQLLSMVWKHSQKATDHSWLKLNHALSDTLFLAVKSGMEFGVGDFQVMANRFNLGYWCGDLERLYVTAVLYRNASAWQAFEAYRKRTPYIVKGAFIRVHTGDGPAGQGLARLIVGAEFAWKGERVKVSSFNDKNGSLSACTYTSTEGESCPACNGTVKWPERKLLHRYTITHQDLRDASKKAREVVA